MEKLLDKKATKFQQKQHINPVLHEAFDLNIRWSFSLSSTWDVVFKLTHSTSLLTYTLFTSCFLSFFLCFFPPTFEVLLGLFNCIIFHCSSLLVICAGVLAPSPLVSKNQILQFAKKLTVVIWNECKFFEKFFEYLLKMWSSFGLKPGVLYLQDYNS